MRRLAGLVLVVALGLAGCGGASMLSNAQLYARATRTCNLARRRTNRIATPTLPSEGVRFLSRGIAALAPELRGLELLQPPTSMASEYRRALAASAGELRALRSGLNGLRAGNDPVVAIRTLQLQLVPLEQRASGAWRGLGIRACDNS